MNDRTYPTSLSGRTEAAGPAAQLTKVGISSSLSGLGTALNHLEDCLCELHKKLESVSVSAPAEEVPPAAPPTGSFVRGRIEDYIRYVNSLVSRVRTISEELDL